MRIALLSASCMMLATTALAVGCSKDDHETDRNTDESEQKVYMPDWQKGYLDIHHIATNRGDATFVIAPDGTTMLIDAGDVGQKGWGANGGPTFPDESKTPGEWIAAYIAHFTANLDRPSTLDYMWLTHFHGDHMGTSAAAEDRQSALGNWRLSGLTMVGEHLKGIGTIVDRAYPAYDVPTKEACMNANGDFMQDWTRFVEHWTRKGARAERFKAGSASQFVLKHDAGAYPTFSVRNLVVNGEVWTGRGENAVKHYTDLTKFDENALSGAIRIAYGPFAYFAGGDLGGATDHSQYTCAERDMETPVSKVCGKVTVLKANHHGCGETCNNTFLRALEPADIVILGSHVLHPYGSTLARILDPLVWKADAALWITSDLSRKQLGSQFDQFKPYGHVVFRVYTNGTQYETFVLDPLDADYSVKYRTGMTAVPAQ